MSFMTTNDPISIADAAARLMAGGELTDAERLGLMWSCSEARRHLDSELLRRERLKYTSPFTMPPELLTALERAAVEDRKKEDEAFAQRCREDYAANAELRRQQALAPMIERQRIPEKGTPEWVEAMYPLVNPGVR